MIRHSLLDYKEKPYLSLSIIANTKLLQNLPPTQPAKNPTKSIIGCSKQIYSIKFSFTQFRFEKI